MPKTKFKEPITIKFSGMVARVYVPMLDPAERERRMKKIHNTAALLAKQNEGGK